MRDKARHQSWYDGSKYPELFMQRYDSAMDRNDREKGISSLKKEVRDLIKYRFENGYYPERLHYLAIAELELKHPEE
jgi:hypothetical protein